MYFLEIREDYSDNTGDPVLSEWSGPFDHETATAEADKATAEDTYDNGITRTATLYHARTEDGETVPDFDRPAFLENIANSAPLPPAAVLVFFRHIGKGMNYAYQITDVRDACREKTYSDLPYSRDSQQATWCAVFDSPAELVDSWTHKGFRPFNKLQSGSIHVERYFESITE